MVEESTGLKKSSHKEHTIRYKVTYGRVVLDAFKSRGWVEIAPESTAWDISWCDCNQMREYYDHSFLKENQRINHFRNFYELCRKNMLMKNLRRLKRHLQKSGTVGENDRLTFCPPTFELPSEYHIFAEEYRKSPRTTWIMKPAAKSMGRGIFLIQRLHDVDEWKVKDRNFVPSCFLGDKDQIMGPETYVVQRYIDNPYLIGGRKFDLRLYVLVMSYTPLRIWLYREGFARFSTAEFTMAKLSDSIIHLTNTSIQKEECGYNAEQGGKWGIGQLWQYMRAKHGDEAIKEINADIANVIVKTLQSVAHAIQNDRHCFELYGYDILLDVTLKSWLIEVNSSPSMSTTGEKDYCFKQKLISDMLDVVDMERKLSGNEIKIGGFDLVWDDGEVTTDNCQCVCFKSRTDRQPNHFLGSCIE